MPEVRESTVTEASPDEILWAAYPRRLRRARAVRWLSWIAWESRGGSFGWWDVPWWLGEDALRWPRQLVTTALIWTGFGLGFGLFNGGEIGLSMGFTLGLGAGWLAGKLAPRPDREPFALVPRLPRTAREARALAVGVASGVLLRRTLIRQWGTEVTNGTPDSAYRACLRSALVDAMACLTAGLPLTIVALLAGEPWLLVPAGLVTGFSALFAVLDEPALAVWLAYTARPPHRRRWDSFRRLGSTRRLLTGAERRGLIRPRGARYEFASAAVRDHLIGLEQAVIDANTLRALERKRRTESAQERRAARRQQHAQIAAAARMSERVRTTVLAGSVAAAGLITLGTGPAAMRHGLAAAGVALMPGITVAVVSGWAVSLLYRRWHAARSRLVRHVAEILPGVVAGVACALLADHTLPGAQAAFVLLLPLAVWLSIKGWQAMNRSQRFQVRAVADIAVSLMLGAALTGTLAWLANLLRMPSAEVTALHDTVDKISKLLDAPWWAWASAYGVLAALGVAILRWPGRLRRVTDWFAKLVPWTEVLRRGSVGAHIGLLLIALIGAAVPPAVGPVLRARLADKYTLTLTDIARARGATAELRSIASELPLLRVPLVPLADLVLDIHKASKQADGENDASEVELDLAQRLGTLQALTLAAADSTPPVEQAEARVTQEAGLDTPADSAKEEGKRLGELADAEHEDDAAKERAEQVGELTATTVAKLLPPLPGLGSGEVVGILKEYLSALVEFSPLKDIFAASAERLSTRTAPPDVADLVVPDPGKLKDAAAAQANQEVAKTPVADPAKFKALLAESGIVGAVNLVNQTRFLLENGVGPCDGCARPESGNDNGGPDHPDEPPVEPVP